MAAAFGLPVIAILTGLIVALCGAAWLQWRRMRHVLKGIETGRIDGRGGGSPGGSGVDEALAQRYVRTALFGLVGFAIIAADLAYAVVTSLLRLASDFFVTLFIITGFLGIGLLWLSSYLTSKLFGELREEEDQEGSRKAST